MNIKIILIILFFVILISIQYTLNLIYREVKEIRRYLGSSRITQWGRQLKKSEENIE